MYKISQTATGEPSFKKSTINEHNSKIMYNLTSLPQYQTLKIINDPTQIALANKQQKKKKRKY